MLRIDENGRLEGTELQEVEFSVKDTTYPKGEEPVSTIKLLVNIEGLKVQDLIDKAMQAKIVQCQNSVVRDAGYEWCQTLPVWYEVDFTEMGKKEAFPNYPGAKKTDLNTVLRKARMEDKFAAIQELMKSPEVLEMMRKNGLL